MVPTRPKPEDRETDWSRWISTITGGIPEYRLPDGSRIDVYHRLAGYSWEVEWPEKWSQAIGQSLYYAKSMNNNPGIILLMGRRPLKLEIVYYLRCLSTAGNEIKLITLNVRTGLFSHDIGNNYKF